MKTPAPNPSPAFSKRSPFHLLRSILATLLFLGTAPHSQAQESNQNASASAFQMQKQLEELQLEIKEIKDQQKVYSELKDELEAIAMEVSTIQEKSIKFKGDSLISKIETLDPETSTDETLIALNNSYNELLAHHDSQFYTVSNKLHSKREEAGIDSRGRMYKKSLQKVLDAIDSRKKAIATYEPQSFIVGQGGGLWAGGSFKLNKEETLKAIEEKKPLLEKGILLFSSKDYFSKCKAAYLEPIQEEAKSIEIILTDKVAEEQAKASAAEEAYNRINGEKKEQFKIDRILVWTLPLYGLLMALMMLIPKFYSGAAIREAIFGSGLILQLITVYLLTATILILGIGGKISSEVLGTLIGGISGYVLGRNMKSAPQIATSPTATTALLQKDE